MWSEPLFIKKNTIFEIYLPAEHKIPQECHCLCQDCGSFLSVLSTENKWFRLDCDKWEKFLLAICKHCSINGLTRSRTTDKSIGNNNSERKNSDRETIWTDVCVCVFIRWLFFCCKEMPNDKGSVYDGYFPCAGGHSSHAKSAAHIKLIPLLCLHLDTLAHLNVPTSKHIKFMALVMH